MPARGGPKETPPCKAPGQRCPFQQVLDVEALGEDCRCLCTVEPVGFTVAEGEKESAGESALTATAMLRLTAWRPLPAAMRGGCLLHPI